MKQTYQTVVCMEDSIEELKHAIQTTLNDFHDEGYAFNYLSIVSEQVAILVFIDHSASILLRHWNKSN